jgi:acetyl/propionyl-CoA carboxylase alpha subunit
VEGGEVSIYYDPMIAKVIAAAETRALATNRMIAALRDFRIAGVRTNLPFVIRILATEAFRDGSIDTAFLDREGAAIAATIDEDAVDVRNESTITNQSAINNQSAIRNPQSAMSSFDPWNPGARSARYAAPAADAPRRRSARGSAGHGLVAPMPATVIKILVAPGQSVKKGDTLVVLEAMKMELPIRAPADATVAAVCCREGDLVQADVALVEFS